MLSDGKDESSRFDFDEALTVAQRSGVTLYTIGLDVGKLDTESRRTLKRLAEETGGESYFVDDSADLGAIYREIEQRLRSRYLLVYQAPPTESNDFRRIEIRVRGDRYRVETLAGYYP